MKYILSFIVLLLIASCNTFNNESVLYSGTLNFAGDSPMINQYGKTVLERFDAPLGYNRVRVPQDGFESYLRSLPLKPNGALARYYNGETKLNNNIYVSVIDLPISNKNLQISTNAVMRLISEYLYKQKEYEKIAFHTDNEKLSFVEFSDKDYSDQKFNNYMDFVMERISTPSFCSDLKKVALDEIKIGDIFVQNSVPYGHAVIVVDLVENNKGEKLILLAQSFQPAQEIQIISNPNREDLSPWYEVKEGELLTPEWRFMTSDLMRFKFLAP